MVEIYKALRAFLLDDATVTSIVGTRVFPLKLPQGVIYPAITITRVSAVRENVLSGPASAATPRYQIDCWTREASGSTAFSDAQVLGSAVRDRLEGYVGVMTDSTVSPPADYQTAVSFEDERDLYEGDVTGGYFRHSADYFVFHGVHAVTA